MAERQLGSNFRKLWGALGISGVGDGVYTAALPLLAATLTRDPIAVSAVLAAAWLPWVVFGLFAGVFIDRWDRFRTMWIVDAVRLLIVGGLAVLVMLDLATVPLLIVVGFLLGTGNTFFDVAAQAALPTLVSRNPAQLGRANSRLQTTNVLGTQFAGPPLGGVLFGLSAPLPFLADALTFGVSSYLVARIRRPAAEPAPAGDEAGAAVGDQPGAGSAIRRMRHEVGEGLRWLVEHRVLRTMTALVAAVNLAGAMCLATLVLFVQEKIGLGNVGYGVILACMAAGGAIGGLVATRLVAAVGAGVTSLGAFYLVGAATIGIGLTSTPWICGLLMAVNGLSAMVFNVVFHSLRQELVPDRLLGRVGGTVLLLCYAAMPVGGVIGGLLGDAIGLRAPFLVAGALIPLLALAATPMLTNKAVQMARTEPDLEADAQTPPA